MEGDEFRERGILQPLYTRIPLNTEVHISNTTFTGKEMVDYVTDYLENIRNRKVFPSVTPGKYNNMLHQFNRHVVGSLRFGKHDGKN